MRIGFDARWYNESGVGTYVLGLLSAYSRVRSGDVEVIAFEDPRNPVPVESGGLLRKVSAKVDRYSFSEQIVLRALCTRERVDAFHSPFYIVPQFCHCPVIATLFDLAPFHFAIYNTLKTSLVRQGYRAAARKSSRVITCSEYSARDIAATLNVPREGIRVIALAAIDESFSATTEVGDEDALRRLQVRRPYVMLLGAGNWRTKNLDGGLRAIARCQRESPIKCQTVFAGRPDALHDPKVRRDAAGLDVRVTGPVSTSDLAVLYRHSSVFLFPSRFEGFGVPVLEAMSSGCPTVCSNTASLAEVAGDGAITVDPDDVDSMASALSMLLADDATRQFWKARALRRASKYSFWKTALETLEVYRDVVGVRPSTTGDSSPQGKRCLEVR